MNKIYESFDWIEINKQYSIYKKWSNEWLKQKNNKLKQIFKAENPAPDYIQPKLNSYDLTTMDMALADIPLVRENGKVSTTLTLQQELREEQRALVHYLASLTSRSELYASSSKECARHCALVPLFMAAHKEYNNVSYEEWNKKDKFLWLAVGSKLDSEIKRWLDIPLSENALKVARRNALTNKSGKNISPSQWPYHSIQIGGIKVSAASLVRHIMLQTWLANVEYRNKYMILDIHDWDLVPQALDAVVEKPKPVAMPEYQEEEELPW